jgi:capsular polysaccharide biosynthesis protein
MELREYGLILYRRWWIPLLLALLVALISAWQLRPWQSPPPTYTASISMLVGVLPLADADVTSYDPRYYAWLTSEYLVDDFTEVVRSSLFAQGVNERLQEQELQIPAGLISGSATTGRRHRIIWLTINWGDQDQLLAISGAAVAELQESIDFYFQQLGTDNAMATVLDGPIVTTIAPDLRQRLEFPLRVILAFLAGIVLVFVIEYMDTSVRRDRELEEIGLPVVGIIPRQ